MTGAGLAIGGEHEGIYHPVAHGWGLTGPVTSAAAPCDRDEWLLTCPTDCPRVDFGRRGTIES